VLDQARRAGVSPATVVDVGAAYGAFTRVCHGIFPRAAYVLVEPLEEYKPFLDEVTRSVAGARSFFAAAAPRPGETVLNVHPDWAGSSLYREEEESDVNGVPRTVPAVALDSLQSELSLQAPFLLKVDVQGAELDVLAGAGEVLRGAEYVLLEVSLFEFFKGGPQFHDVVTFMKSHGFVAYDVYGLQYRPLDQALAQVDIAFVKEGGSLRQHHHYATSRQREEQNRRFERRRKELLRRQRSQ
jgi:FkbM family methyltransferase